MLITFDGDALDVQCAKQQVIALLASAGFVCRYDPHCVIVECKPNSEITLPTDEEWVAYVKNGGKMPPWSGK